MSQVVVSTYVTLDGIMEDPGWSAPYWSNEAQLFARDQLWASGALKAAPGREAVRMIEAMASDGVQVLMTCVVFGEQPR